MNNVIRCAILSTCLLSSAALAEANQAKSTAAEMFGAVPAVDDISLSPDGSKLAFIASGGGGITDLFVIDLSQAKQPPVRVTRATGDRENLYWCNWISNVRLVCEVGGRQEYNGDTIGMANIVPNNTEGSRPKLFSNYRRSVTGSFSSGAVLDWLPYEENNILMMRGADGL